MTLNFTGHLASKLPDFRPRTGTISVAIDGVVLTLTDEMYAEPAVVLSSDGDDHKAVSVRRLAALIRADAGPEPAFVTFPPEVSS